MNGELGMYKEKKVPIPYLLLVLRIGNRELGIKNWEKRCKLFIPVPSPQRQINKEQRCIWLTAVQSQQRFD
ncbi:hypothetical protein NIES4103_20630 [Nostoc sp. NIES-4103]|nr:hypothetical protein NIES4103_20630 [Nostoc sp. NIES-4103]